MDTSVLFRSVTVSLPFCCTVQKNRQYFVPQLREQSSKCHFFSSQLSRSILVSGHWNCYHFLQLIQSYECLKNSFSRDHLIRCFCWPRLYDRNRRARSWHRQWGGGGSSFAQAQNYPCLAPPFLCQMFASAAAKLKSALRQRQKLDIDEITPRPFNEARDKCVSSF